MEKEFRFFVGVVIIIIVLAIFLGSTTFVGAGERGVVKQFGAVTGRVMGEGLNFKIPIVNGVDKMNVKTLKVETQSSAASKDLQIVTSSIALNYRIRPDNLVWIRQNIGRQQDLQVNIIDPAIQESIKAATAEFTAEELITKRPAVRDQMKLNLQNKLDVLTNSGIVVEEFNIIDFQFSEEFDSAIEAKVTAEQNALKAQRDLERVKFEAQQKIEQAKAEAESIRIQAEALSRSNDVLNLRWIEKWNGVMPIYYSGDSGGMSLLLQPG